MRLLREQYFESDSADHQNKYYLFIIPEFYEAELEGYMVRGKALGFLKTGENAITAAHELAHGIFSLEHTFPQIAQGTTTNLLDYSGGTHLTQKQWQHIHSPLPAFSFLDDEEGESAALVNLEKLNPFRNSLGQLSFLSVSGNPITFDDKLQQIFFITAEDEWKKTNEHLPIGTVGGFKYNDTLYVAIRSLNSPDFLGYWADIDHSKYYHDNFSQNLDFQNTSAPLFTSVLCGIPCIQNGDIVFKVFPTSYFESQINLPDFTPPYYAGGSLKDITYFAPFLINESQAIEVGVQFSSELTPEELAFFKSISNFESVCGLDAIYAFSAAYSLHENPQNLLCLNDIIGNAENQIQSDILNQLTETYLSDLHQLDALYIEPVIIADNPHDEYQQHYSQSIESNFFKYFYGSLDYLVRLITPVQDNSEDLASLPISYIPIFLSLFDPYMKECILKTLPYDVRMNILRRHGEWTVSTSKESLLVDLIRTTPLSSSDRLLEDLSQNNYQLFWELYDEINGANSEFFMMNVCLFILNQRSAPAELSEWPGPQIYNPGGIKPTKFLLIYKPDADQNKIIDAARIGTDVRISYVSSDNGGSTIFRYEGDPFEFVRIKFTENYQFTNLQTSEQIEVGEELVVPAVWAYWLINRQETIQSWTAVRVVVDAAAILFSVVTMNPGPLLYVELLANGADLTLALFEDQVLSSGSDYAQNVYSFIENIVGLLDAAMITVSVTEAGCKIYTIQKSKLSQELKLKSPTSEVYTDFKVGIQNLVETLRNSPSTIFSQGDAIFNAFWESALLQVKVHGHSKYLSDWSNVSLNVSQGNKLFVKSGASVQYQIADVIEDGTDAIRLEEIRWLDSPENVDVIHEFENIYYTKQGTGELLSGDLEVVRLTGDGGVFVREVEVFDNGALDLLNTLFTKSIAQNFLSDLILFAGSNQKRLGRYGSESILKNKLVYFLNHQSVINVKSYNQLIQDIETFFTVTRGSNGNLIPGTLEYFDEFLQAPQKFKGGAFGLEILANPPPSLIGKTLTRLEAGIDDSEKFRFDMYFEGTGNVKVFVETKNYASTTSFTTSFYNQFKAYISNPNLTSFDELRYYFRANDGISKAERVQKFKNMIKNNAQEIFGVNPSLFKSIKQENGVDFIDDWEDLKTMMESTTISENHAIFSFIEVF
ncbi:MAG: hypothetical protein IPM74_11955 [Crocinitomicaceae bacterium]|nr:hypothetical protein [Crocinitomicaceae bacterium]